jgi:hypothetical protein
MNSNSNWIDGVKITSRQCSLALVSVSLSLIACFIVAEAALRVAGFEPAMVAVKPFSESWAAIDPTYGWINRTGSFVSDEPGNRTMSFNDDGSRKDPFSGKEKKDLPLAIIIGCSYTQGYGIEDKETYASLLNQNRNDLKFINFGTGGYGAYQSSLRLENEVRVLAKRPKLIIYGFIEDHLRRDVAAAEWAEALHLGNAGTIVPPHVRLDKSDTGLRTMRGEIRSGWFFEKQSALVHLAHQVANKVTLGSVTRKERLEVMEKLITKMKVTSSSVDSHFLVIGLDYASKDVSDQLQKLGPNFVDCRVPPSGLSPEYRLGGIAHPNEKANMYWSRCISKAIDPRSRI